MGWAVGYDTRWKRDIGYGVLAYCDAPGCTEEIDRGLGYVCGAQPYGGEKGCGLFFCGKHQKDAYQRCSRCHNHRDPYDAKPDHPRWIEWKLIDESWRKWRDENPKEVFKLRSRLPQGVTPLAVRSNCIYAEYAYDGAMELESSAPKPSRIRRVRLDAGLSQTEAAKIVLVSLRTWQNWEAGNHEMNPILWSYFREWLRKRPVNQKGNDRG